MNAPGTWPYVAYSSCTCSHHVRAQFTTAVIDLSRKPSRSALTIPDGLLEQYRGLGSLDWHSLDGLVQVECETERVGSLTPVVEIVDEVGDTLRCLECVSRVIDREPDRFLIDARTAYILVRLPQRDSRCALCGGLLERVIDVLTSHVNADLSSHLGHLLVC